MYVHIISFHIGEITFSV